MVEALPRGYVVEDVRLAAAAGVPVTRVAEALEKLRSDGWVELLEGGGDWPDEGRARAVGKARRRCGASGQQGPSSP
ncbi:hypothetical protein GCM10029992_60820 [Glycomyces albus]